MKILITCRRASLAASLVLVLACPGIALAETRVVVLGTGTPVPDGSRAGPAVAVVYNDRAYIFDIGGGAVQRAIEASERLGIDALYPTSIEHLFITHLHSDHTLDYSELAATLWWRRENRLKAWGPRGLAEMSEGMYEMFAKDIAIRNGGGQPVVNPDYYRVEVTEIDEGVVVEEDGVRIEAFEVPHGDIRPAFGYRVTTPDKTVVISGDTSFSEKLIEMARGVDVLVHEAISQEGLSGLSEFWQNYHGSAHTTTGRLAEVASRAQPGLLVIYHVLYYGASEESVLAEVRAGYDGDVVLANDLDEF